jgi:hypothetical protein
MVIEPATLPDLNALDQSALRALILVQHEQLHSRDIQIKHLELLVIELRMTQFGRKNEKLDNQTEQPGLREHLARAALLAAAFCE